MKYLLVFIIFFTVIGLNGCGSSSSGDGSKKSGNDEFGGSKQENIVDPDGSQSGSTQTTQDLKYIANGHPTATQYGISNQPGTPPSFSKEVE